MKMIKLHRAVASSAAGAIVPARSPPAARLTVCRAALNDATPASASPALEQPGRRALLIGIGLSAFPSPPAMATALQDITRSFVRPEGLSPVDAVVILMDAKSTLKEIADIAATPQDSQLRFVSRKLWPGFAKRLREVGPAAPVVAAIASGIDKEATLSEQYGGTAGATPGVVDRVYIGLGNVLTISGRTIKPEAQASPKAADDARVAIEEFLAKVPQDALQAAQDFRIQRAAALS